MISAKQMLVELANREAGRLGDVVDLMDFSRRRLKNDDSGEVVRTRQQKIIDLLDQLIKEAEDKEKQSSSSSSSSGVSGNSIRQPSNPMQKRLLPAETRGGRTRRQAANPGEMWGSMPPAERERVLQALRAYSPAGTGNSSSSTRTCQETVRRQAVNAAETACSAIPFLIAAGVLAIVPSGAGDCRGRGRAVGARCDRRNDGDGPMDGGVGGRRISVSVG